MHITQLPNCWWYKQKNHEILWSYHEHKCYFVGLKQGTSQNCNCDFSNFSRIQMHNPSWTKSKWIFYIWFRINKHTQNVKDLSLLITELLEIKLYYQNYNASIFWQKRVHQRLKKLLETISRKQNFSFLAFWKYFVKQFKRSEDICGMTHIYISFRHLFYQRPHNMFCYDGREWHWVQTSMINKCNKQESATYQENLPEESVICVFSLHTSLCA